MYAEDRGILRKGIIRRVTVIFNYSYSESYAKIIKIK